MQQQRTDVKRNVLYRGKMPYSEVCMHMGIAGKLMGFKVVGPRSVQLYDGTMREFSFPVLLGEAGVYQEGDKLYAYDIQEVTSCQQLTS